MGVLWWLCGMDSLACCTPNAVTHAGQLPAVAGR